MSKTLGDALPEAMARAREIQKNCREIGPSGRFLDALIEKDLRMAEKATMEGNIAMMIAAYENLMAIEE